MSAGRIPHIIDSHRDKSAITEIDALCRRFWDVSAGLDSNQVYFPLNVPSSKNSRSKGYDSPLVTRFYRKMAPFLLFQRSKILKIISNLGDHPTYPIMVSYLFRRDSARKFDYGNVIETVNDMLDGKKYFGRKGPKNLTWVSSQYREKILSVSDVGVIPDDDFAHLIPVPDPRGYPNVKDVDRQGCIASFWSRDTWLRMLDDPFDFD